MKKIVLFLFAIAFLAVTGCQREAKRPEGTPLVVTSIPPYVSLVKSIVGETMEVKAALGPDFDPHNTEGTPQEMKMVQDADLFVGVGEGYETKLTSSIREGSKEVQILELDQKIPLLSYSDDVNLVNACDGSGHASKGGKDLHFWLSPKRLVLQVKILTEALINLKPENQSLYKRNEEALLKQIKALDRKLEKDLHSYQKRSIIVSHPSLGYFCHDYGLVQIAIECEGKSPLPQNVTQIVDMAQNADAICVFTAPQFNNKGAQLVAQKLNLRTVTFDPLNEEVLETIEQIANGILNQ